MCANERELAGAAQAAIVWYYALFNLFFRDGIDDGRVVVQIAASLNGEVDERIGRAGAATANPLNGKHNVVGGDGTDGNNGRFSPFIHRQRRLHPEHILAQVKCPHQPIVADRPRLGKFSLNPVGLMVIVGQPDEQIFGKVKAVLTADLLWIDGRTAVCHAQIQYNKFVYGGWRNVRVPITPARA